MMLMSMHINAQEIYKISPNIKLSIIDNNVFIAVCDNDIYDGHNNLYPISLGKTPDAISILTQMENDLEHNEPFSTLSYDISNSQLIGIYNIDEYGNKYILINTDHQYEIYLSHIKKMKKKIIKHIKNESK